MMTGWLMPRVTGCFAESVSEGSSSRSIVRELENGEIRRLKATGGYFLGICANFTKSRLSLHLHEASRSEMNFL